jgi:hypothetical protein
MNKLILTITLFAVFSNKELLANAAIATQPSITKIQQSAGVKEPQVDHVSLRKSPKITPIKRHSITPMLS